MTVVADVDAHLAPRGVECRIAQVAGTKVELLPKAWRDVGKVILAILAQIRPVGVKNGGGVVEQTGNILLEHWHHYDHPVLPRQFLHQPHRCAVGDLLRQLTPTVVLFCWEIGTGEQLLQAQDFHSLASGFLYEGDVLVEHGLPEGL